MPFELAMKEELKWRISIIISSRDLSRVMEPLVYLDIRMESGEKCSIEVPVSKFHTLRQKVALLLKEMEIIKSKSSSITRIIDSA